MSKSILLKPGQKFFRLTVVSLHHISKYISPKGQKHNNEYYLCKCDCGNSKIIRKNLLGITKSCGCLDNETKTKHGMFGTRIYRIWADMKNRCDNKFNTAYNYYGGRGIKYCPEWKDFENFYEWAKDNGYAENLTIDRICVNGNYDPSNCRWITKKEQSRNTRANKFFEFNGEIHCMSEWAEITGIKKGTLHRRLKSGWKFEKAIKTRI